MEEGLINEGKTASSTTPPPCFSDRWWDQRPWANKYPSKRCQCVSKCCCMSSLIVLITCVATYFLCKDFLLTGSDVSRDVVPSTCNNTLAFYETYYSSKSVVSGQAHFKYAFLFAPTTTYSRGDGKGNVYSGHMFICDQTTGMQASGPDNCTNFFTYDEYTCALSTQLSKCQSDVQHQHTDVEIAWIQYNGVDDTVVFDGARPRPLA